MKRTNVILAVAVVLSVTACKKKTVVTKKDQLVQRDWVMTGAILNSGGKEVDEFAILQSCDKDDISHFDIDGIFHYDEGATKCDPTDPQETTGSWTLNSEETVLTVVTPGLSKIMNVIELSDGQLKVSTTDISGNHTYTYQTK